MSDRTPVAYFADQPTPVIAEEVASILVMRQRKDENGKVRRAGLKFDDWTPNPFELTEELLIEKLPPGDYVVQARNPHGQVLGQKPLRVEALEPDDEEPAPPAAHEPAGGLFASAAPPPAPTGPALTFGGASMPLVEMAQAAVTLVGAFRAMNPAPAASPASVGDAEDRVRWYRAELDRKATELDDLRRAHRQELERTDTAHRTAVDDLRAKLRKAEDELTEVKRNAGSDILRVKEALAEAELQLEHGTPAQKQDALAAVIEKVSGFLPQLLPLLAGLAQKAAAASPAAPAAQIAAGAAGAR